MASAAEVQVARQRAGAPIVKLTASPTAGDAPLTVTFSTDGTGSGAPLTSWTLNFGDDTQARTGRGPLPRTIDHLYQRPGEFTATLIRDTQAASGRGETSVTVTAAPGPSGDDGAIVGVRGGDESHKAVLAAAAGIVAAFDRFLVNRRPEQAAQVEEIIQAEAPALPAERRQEVVDVELAAERAYAAKARARLDRDVPVALRIADPEERERALDRILSRERRYLEARERAIAERATGRAAAAMVRVLSATGAFWKINPLLDNCAWCRAMAGKAWTWDVLSVYTPPVHLNCACTLVPLEEAVRRGWLPAGVSPLTMASLPTLSLLESRPDPTAHEHGPGCQHDDDEEDLELEDLLDLVEAAYDRRWGKGTESAGQFRPKRGGDPGARLRRRRSLRMPRLHDPAPVRGRDPTPVQRLDPELDVREHPTADLQPGDEILVGGELDRVVKVDPRLTGLLTLERAGLVHIDRPTVMAVTHDGRGTTEPEAKGLEKGAPVPAGTTWGDLDPGDRLRHPDGTVMTVRKKLKRGVVVSMDYSASTDEELLGIHARHGVRDDQTSPSLPVGGNLIYDGNGVPERPDLPAPADGDRYVLRLAEDDDGENVVEIFDREQREAWGNVPDADVDRAIALAAELNAEHRAEVEAAGPAPPQPGGGPTLDDALKVARMRRPKEAGQLAPGFHFDPELSRSSATGDDLHLPPGFFKQTRAVREKVVLRHLGSRLADGLGADGIAGLREQEPTLSSKRAIVDAYYALNSDNRGQFTTLRPEAARLVATAAVERGLPLHPDAGKLARRPAAADAPEAEHPAHDLARAIVGRNPFGVSSVLGAAGWPTPLTDGEDRVVWRNHDQHVSITATYGPPDAHGEQKVETADVAVAAKVPDDVRADLTAGEATATLNRLRDEGFKTTQRGGWFEQVHPDGRAYALKPSEDRAKVAEVVAFTPTAQEIRAARIAIFKRNPLAAIKVGDDADEIVALLDGTKFSMEFSALNGERMGGAKVELPEGTAGFEAYGRGPDAFIVQYADRDGRRVVTAVGLADPDPQHPGRIVTPAEHAATTARLAEEARAREEAAKAAAAKAAGGLDDAIRAGDAAGLRAALGDRTVSEAVRFLQGEGYALIGRRRARDRTTRESSVTYTMRGKSGETLKITGPLIFGRAPVSKVEVQANPQGGRRDRLPRGQAPKTLDDLLVDSLGRGDELAARFGAEIRLEAISPGNVAKGAAAHYEPSTGIIAIGKSTQVKRVKAYLAKRKKGERFIDSEHLTFYDDVETLQHEINHAVYKDASKGRNAYSGLNKNVEEALTEETAHLLTADWLRSWGMTDVLAALKRNPEDPRAKGVYRNYRVQLRAILDAGGVPESDRPDLLLRMKFQMTNDERNAELVRLAGAPDLRTAINGTREDLDRRYEMHRNFEPVVRPDLSDIDAEPTIETAAGRTITAGMSVMAESIDGKRVPAVVVAIRAGGIRVRYEDGTELWVGVGHIE